MNSLSERALRVPAYVPMLVFLIVAAFSLAAYGTKRSQEQVDFLCKTSGSLALVMDSAADQIQENFDNGTYRHLLAKDIIAQSNVTAARRTLREYRQQVAILRDKRSPCGGVK